MYMDSPGARASAGLSGLKGVRGRAAVVVILGLVALALALRAAASSPVPPWPVLLLLVALLGPAVLVELPLRLGNRRVQIAGLFEAALLIALTLHAGPWIVLIAAVCTVAREAFLHRSRVQQAVNIAGFVGPTGASLVVLHSLSRASAGPVHVGALVISALTFSVLNELLLDWVIAAATGGQLLTTLRADALTSGIGLLVNVSLGLAVLGAVATGQWALVLAAPVILVMVVRRYRRRLLLDTTADALPRLRLAAERLETIEISQAVPELLDRAAALFAVEHVQLVLLGWPGVGDQTHTRTGAHQVETVCGRRADRGDPADPNVLSARLLAGPADSAEVLGELRLSFPRVPDLSVAEQQVLDTFVSTIASSVLQTRSYAEQVHAARTDPLTGLGNRLAFNERLEQLLPEVLDATATTGPARAPGLAVLLFDLDHFKEVNDTLGHSAGDALLIELAGRLARALRAGDLVTRLGGDEFAVLLQNMTTGRQAQAVADTLLLRLNEPVLIDNLELPVEASVGVALAPRDGTSAQTLLRCADIAMYRAKHKRNTAVVYDPSMDPAGEERLQLVAQLQTAIHQRQIVVHYQPIVCLLTGVVLGAEALVRWQHPQRGLLPPGAFIPAVERTALIVPLTLAVLDQAVREAVTWPSDRADELTVSVNLSPRCLLVRSIPDQVVRILASHGLPARRLTLEITETLALSDLEVVDDVLTRLRDLGVRLSVDDFGTGYSSMSFLRKIAVNEVKVDRSFVAEAPHSRNDRAIVHGTVALAHGLGVPVIGEGVETLRQLRTLRASGCDAAQGFLLGRPMPARDLPAVFDQPNRTVLAELESTAPSQRRTSGQR